MNDFIHDGGRHQLPYSWAEDAKFFKSVQIGTVTIAFYVANYHDSRIFIASACSRKSSWKSVVHESRRELFKRLRYLIQILVDKDFAKVTARLQGGDIDDSEWD